MKVLEIRPRKLKEFRIDRLDSLIIGMLRANGKLTNAAIARYIGVSEETVRRRIQRLTANGILHPTVLVNQQGIGLPASAVIALDWHIDKDKTLIQQAKDRGVEIHRIVELAPLDGHNMLMEISAPSTALLFSFIGDLRQNSPKVFLVNDTYYLA